MTLPSALPIVLRLQPVMLAIDRRTLLRLSLTIKIGAAHGAVSVVGRRVGRCTRVVHPCIGCAADERHVVDRQVGRGPRSTVGELRDLRCRWWLIQTTSLRFTLAMTWWEH